MPESRSTGDLLAQSLQEVYDDELPVKVRGEFTFAVDTQIGPKHSLSGKVLRNTVKFTLTSQFDTGFDLEVKTHGKNLTTHADTAAEVVDQLIAAAIADPKLLNLFS
jgi:hypothetical protein